MDKTSKGEMVYGKSANFLTILNMNIKSENKFVIYNKRIR